MIYDIAVIGAGVVGGMIARELSKYDLSICLLEKENDVAMGASKANSGIVHAGYDAKSGSLKALLNVRGAKMMEQIADELDVKYVKNGSLVVGFNSADMKVVDELLERGAKNSVEGLKKLTKDELRRLEPNISKNAIGGLYAPTGGIICPYKLTIAVIGNAMDNGVELKLGYEVTDIKFNGCYEISSDSEVIKAIYVINAAGVHADELIEVSNNKKLQPKRGEYLILDKECGNLVSHTIFKVPTKAGKGILVTPTVDGNLLLGPTHEDIPDKADTRTTSAGIEKIINGATECVPNIPLKNVISSFSGLRAGTEYGDFIIERAGDNFINVMGIDSPGLTASPAIAVYVTDILKEMGMKLISKDSFNPKRKIFNAEKSRYHKIICRCEGISQGEIIEAINTNPRATDVDGVKRRTRSGMGRCQGGFCMPYIIEILADELGIPIEDVTKFGGSSKIIIDRTKVTE